MKVIDKVLNLIPSKIDTTSEKFQMGLVACGVYMLGTTLICGAYNALWGVVTGVIVTTSPREESTSVFDKGCDALEYAGVFLVRTAVSALRHGIKGAFWGVNDQATFFMTQSWCRFHPIISPKNNTPITVSSEPTQTSQITTKSVADIQNNIEPKGSSVDSHSVFSQNNENANSSHGYNIYWGANSQG